MSIESANPESMAARLTCFEEAPRNDLPGLENFAQISPGLYRGAQPSRGGFETLRGMGVRTIINLRAYRGDTGKLKGLGLRYAHLRCRAWLPSQNKLAIFLRIALDPGNQPVFVHCLHGSDRTGLAIAAYRIMEQGWTLDHAIEELHTFGFHHRIFPQILRFLKRFDAASMKTFMSDIEMPNIL